MTNLVKNLKMWICEICKDNFQAVEPYRAATGERVCKSCQWDVLYSLDQEQN